MTEEQIKEELEKFFYKVDVDGLDYALENYFPYDLLRSEDQEIKNFVSECTEARDHLGRTKIRAEFLRERFDIQES